MVLAALAVVLVMGYVQLTTISGSVSEMKNELTQLNTEHVALLTRYEQTYDLASVKEAAEAAGMSKPSSGQITYIDLGQPRQRHGLPLRRGRLLQQNRGHRGRMAAGGGGIFPLSPAI